MLTDSIFFSSIKLIPTSKTSHRLRYVLISNIIYCYVVCAIHVIHFIKVL